MCWSFPRFLEDAAVELVGITKRQYEESGRGLPRKTQQGKALVTL